MQVLVIDNYDSFTYNLAQVLNEVVSEAVVVVDDEYLHRSSPIGLPARELDCLEYRFRLGKCLPILVRGIGVGDYPSPGLHSRQTVLEHDGPDMDARVQVA